jgi:hypothetical protein
LPLHGDGLGDDLHDVLFQRQDVVLQTAEALCVVPGVDPVTLLKTGDPLAALESYCQDLWIKIA